MPPFAIDFILVFILGLCVLIYLRATTINDWEEMKSFPTLLLLIGIFRVSMNVSTTRAILTGGNAGIVIERFGEFVIGGNLLIGIVIFIVMIIFQFIIANGSSRTAEVSARFTLDALPGKQMSIDADLNQRIITEEEAKAKRKKLSMETDFYGSMDGAGKFIKGDVVFGIVMTIINISVGLVVGIVQEGLPLAEAALKYTTLTVGDGIISQVGSLLIAISSGILVTRVYDSESEDTIVASIFKELMKSGMVTYALAAMFILMGVLTPLPLIPFAGVGAVVGFFGYITQKSLKEEEERALKKELEMLENEAQPEHNQESDSFGITRDKYPIIVELGLDLAALVKQKIDGETAKDKVMLMRKSIVADMGVNVPGINFRDNTSFKPRGKYEIRVRGVKVAEGILNVGYLLALKTPHVMEELNAQPTKDPVFQEDGYWIMPHMLEEAQSKNYQVLEPMSILVTHLDVMVRKSVYELLQRQQTKQLLDSLEQDHQVLLDEINKKDIELSLIQNVLRQLLKEGISIRDLPTIIEAIVDGKAIYNNDVDGVTSYVRESISKVICEQIKNEDGKIYAGLFQDAIELETEVITAPHQGYLLNWDLADESRVMEQIKDIQTKSNLIGRDPVLLTRRRDFRFGIVRALERYQIEMPVMAIGELSPEAIVEQIAIIE